MLDSPGARAAGRAALELGGARKNLGGVGGLTAIESRAVSRPGSGDLRDADPPQVPPPARGAARGPRQARAFALLSTPCCASSIPSSANLANWALLMRASASPDGRPPAPRRRYVTAGELVSHQKPVRSPPVRLVASSLLHPSALCFRPAEATPPVRRVRQVTLRRVERVRDLYSALLATRHNGFPVEENGEARCCAMLCRVVPCCAFSPPLSSPHSACSPARMRKKAPAVFECFRGDE